MDLKKTNLMSAWNELNNSEKDIIKNLLERYRNHRHHPCYCDPDLIGFLPRVRVIREVQLWALEKPFDHHDYVYAERIIKKLGGKNFWDPL